MPDTAESPKLLTSIIRELQDNNQVNELIFDSVDMLNSSLMTTVREDYSTDIFTQILERINGIHKSIFKFLNIFAGSDLQDEENRRELLGVLRGIGKEKPKEGIAAPKTEKTAEGLSGLISTLLIGGAGFLIGTVSGFISQLSSMISGVLKDSKIFRALSDFTKKLGGGISKFVKDSKIYNMLSDLVTGIGTRMSSFFLKIKDFFNIKLSGAQSVLGKSKIISGITSRISAFFTPFINLFKFVNGSLSTGTSIFSKLMSPLKAIGSTLKAASVTFGGALKVGKMFGSLLGKLAFPLTVIMGIWDTVTGAIAGYKEDGIKGAIKGGISGLLNGLVGGILDMVKGGISWIAGALGFKQVEKLLDSFSFSGIITSLVTGITDFMSSIFNMALAPFTTIPKMIKEAVAAIGAGGFTGVFEFPKIVLKETLPNPNEHKSGFDPLHWVARAIPDSVYEYAGITKPPSKENIVSETAAAMSGVAESGSKAKEAAAQLQKTKSYDIDNDGVLSDTEFITQLRNEKMIGSLGDKDLDYSTPESSKISDELLKASNAISGERISMPQIGGTGISTPESSKISDELLKASNAISGERISMPQIGGTGISTPTGQPTSQIERIQNNTGSTLNQSSQMTMAMPVIVNNYGGNITNNSTSRVNNTQAIYDPIVTGSSLGIA
jgi:hypothetical protein